MTITKLIKELQRLRKECGPRTIVLVNSQEMQGKVNGVHACTHVMKIGLQVLPQGDGDGFTEFNRDGSTRELLAVVME